MKSAIEWIVLTRTFPSNTFILFITNFPKQLNNLYGKAFRINGKALRLYGKAFRTNGKPLHKVYSLMLACFVGYSANFVSVGLILLCEMRKKD